MQLLVVRHGIAVEREEWAHEHSDATARPLTAEGKKKMKECTKGLRALVPRTAETLSPGEHAPAFGTWLRSQGTKKSVAIVGHEPGLGAIVSWLRPSHLRALG
jgi:phosphohistidine phosphatase